MARSRAVAPEITVASLEGVRAVAAPGNRNANQANWVSIFIGSRDRDTGNSDRKFGRGAFERAFRHRARDFAHSTFGLKKLFRHAEGQRLVAFGVGDEPAIHQLRSTRCFGQNRGEKARRA